MPKSIDEDVEKWQLRQWHHEEIENILKSNGCMDNKGRIRSWRPEAGVLMKECGHTSLDFDKCDCRGEIK